MDIMCDNDMRTGFKRFLSDFLQRGRHPNYIVNKQHLNTAVETDVHDLRTG